MAGPSSSYPILCASFNQDNRWLSNPASDASSRLWGCLNFGFHAVNSLKYEAFFPFPNEGRGFFDCWCLCVLVGGALILQLLRHRHEGWLPDIRFQHGEALVWTRSAVAASPTRYLFVSRLSLLALFRDGLYKGNCGIFCFSFSTINLSKLCGTCGVIFCVSSHLGILSWNDLLDDNGNENEKKPVIPSQS